MHLILTVIALLLLGGADTPHDARSSGRVFELAGGLWWTGDGFEERTMYSVGGVFASERPAAVDSVIDLNGLYIVPPFAEAHTHTIAYVKTRSEEFLEQGVFYALVMNVHRSSIGQNFTWFGRQGSVDVNFTSLGVTASDGHPIQIGLRGDATLEAIDGDWITVVDTREDIENKWPALRAANPDLIKLFLLHSDRYAERHGDTTIASRYKGMDPSLVPPLVERARAAGLRVAAHVRTAYDFRVAVEAGVDIIAHLPGFSMRMPAPDEGGPGSDNEDPEWFRIRPEDAALAAERGITVIPTIGSLGSVPDTLPPDRAARARTFLDTRRSIVTDNLRLLREHGVRIAIGSDAGEGSPVTEALVIHELGVFTEAELLNMLTEHAARVTFPRRSVGRLQDGYEASFVALGGDPTALFAHVRDVKFRFKQGSPLLLGSPADSTSSSAGPAVSPTSVLGRTCDGRASAFRKIIEEFQSRQQNVGLAAAVLVDGDLAYAEAFGWADREANRPTTLDTRFGIASVTKALTGLTLLKLAEEGRVDLDAEIQRYVPEFPEHPEGRVTVRHLASQLGGVRHWGPERNAGLFARHMEDVEEILPLFISDPFAQAPGDGYAYSSYGYNLLAIAMQRATGERFQDIVERTVIRPLGLESMAFDAPGLGEPLRAARYSYYALDDYRELSEPVRVPERNYTHNMAGGNMVADVIDLVRLGESVLEPGFLTEEAYHRVWTRPAIDGIESPMSFGWFVREDGNRVAISGSNPGLQVGLAVWRDEATVVTVVANSWGLGSRSAELVNDDPDGLLGRLAAVCTGS